MAAYVEQLAAGLSGVALPKAKAFEVKGYNGKGLLIGKHNGYVYAAAMMNAGKYSVLAILLRHGATEPGAVGQALQALPTMHGFGKKKQVVAGQNASLVLLPVSFRKPKAPDVAAFLDAATDAIKAMAPPLAEKCEECGSSTSEVVLMNGAPGYHCSGCQQRIVMAKEEEERQYREKPLHLVQGAMYGTVAAVVMGAAMGMLLYWMRDGIPVKLWALVSLAVGAATTYALTYGSEKVDFWKQLAIALVLPLLCNAVADNLLLTRLLMDEFQLPFGLNLFLNVAAELPQFLWRFEYGVIVILAQAGSAAVAVGVLHSLKPKFIPSFVSVGAPAEAPKGQAAGA